MKHQTNDILRLVLAAPAAISGFYLTFFLSIGVHAIVGKACPGIDSGESTCPNWYFSIPIVFAAAVAPTLVVLFGGLTAPLKWRPSAVWIIYALGLSFALIRIGRHAPELTLLAAITGAITAFVLQSTAKSGGT